MFRKGKTPRAEVSFTLGLDTSGHVTTVLEPQAMAPPEPPAVLTPTSLLPGAVTSEWMAAPTLAESLTQQPVAGTSFYQDAIATAAKGRTPTGPKNRVVMAQLAVVEGGEYAGAVGVYLDGARAGAIRRGAAEEYRPVVGLLAARGLPATCRATIYGGHYLDDAEGWRLFGLALLQPTHPAPATAASAFLPPLSPMSVALLDGFDVKLDASLNSTAKNKVARRVAEIEPAAWTVRLDGTPVGRLAPSGSADLVLVERAAAAGFPLTCQLRIIRAPGKSLRVEADVPQP